MSKLAHFVGVLCFCQSIQPLAAQSSLILSSAGTLTLSSVAGNEPAALQWTFSYPSGVTGFSVSAGPALTAAGKTINCAGNSSAYTCLAAGLNSNIIGNGVVGTIAGTVSGFSVAIPSAIAASPAGASIPVSGTGVAFGAAGVSALHCVGAANVYTCTVNLSGAAPAGGALILLSSTNPALPVPASLTIPAAATSATFTATAASVTSAQIATITASLGSSAATAAISLLPVALNVSITAPAAGASLTGTVIITANATGNMAGVQFQLDGANMGSAVTGAGPIYSYSWNTAAASNGPHTIAAIATDKLGNTAISSSLSITVARTPPTVSMIAPAAGASLTGTVTITANATGTVAVASMQFQLDGANLGKAITGASPYSVSWNTAAASNGAHTLAAIATDSAGNTASSTISVTTNNPLLQLHSDASELSGVTNGSIITPTVGPAGFTGTVVVNGTGSVNFTPAQVGNGVYFQSCCTNSNNAYYKFTGATVGNIFNTIQGQITFYLKSRYSFAQRVANASQRYAFDVRDGNSNHLFNFMTQATGYLEFTYMAAGSAAYYFVPAGTEDALFGNGVTLQVTINWSSAGVNLYLNNTLVKTTPYSPPAANWSAASNFDLGAYEYLSFGGYNASDDAIDEFTVSGPPSSSSGPPALTVSMTAPANGTVVSGTTTASASASGPMSLSAVQFTLDGANLGAPVNGTGPSFNYSWNTTGTANGIHTLAAIATDTSGSTATRSITVTVTNSVGPVISGVTASAITSSGVTITWNTNTASNAQVNYGLSASYGSATALAPGMVTTQSVTLTGLSASTTYHYQALSKDAQGNLSSSGDYTFTTVSAPTGPQPSLLLHLDATEVSGVTNGSTVTPSVAPTGYTGTVVVNGTGSVNFTPAQAGNGVYFQSCCANTNNAYYKFTGATVGNIFNTGQGQIAFNLKSRYSFAQRVANAASQRYAFDVRDGNGNHLFYFMTQVVSGQLVFTYMAAGSVAYYYVPAGTEEALFGNGVTQQVTISWSSAGVKFYLLNTLVKSTPYTAPSPNWTAASNFDLGAYEYLTFGGYNVSDDVMDEFSVLPTMHP
jgi:hypothetical protein